MPIPFKAKTEFKSGTQTFEAGNTYSKHEISDELVNAFHQAGMVEVEGLATDIPLNPNSVIVVPDDVIVQNSSVV
jgi:hypothetical protein